MIVLLCPHCLLHKMYTVIKVPFVSRWSCQNCRHQSSHHRMLVNVDFINVVLRVYYSWSFWWRQDSSLVHCNYLEIAESHVWVNHQYSFFVCFTLNYVLALHSSQDTLTLVFLLTISYRAENHCIFRVGEGLDIIYNIYAFDDLTSFMVSKQ